MDRNLFLYSHGTYFFPNGSGPI